ncbi:MAG: hypothetical protein WCE21_01095 [Candidatus Babeliales bacterium]
MQLHTLFTAIILIAASTPHVSSCAADVQTDNQVAEQHPLCIELRAILDDARKTTNDATPVATQELKDRMILFTQKIIKEQIKKQLDYHTMQQLTTIFKDEFEKRNSHTNEKIVIVSGALVLGSCITLLTTISTINAIKFAVPKEVSVTQGIKTALWASIAYFVGKFALYTGKRVVDAAKDLKLHIIRYKEDKALYNQAKELEQSIDVRLRLEQEINVHLQTVSA